MGDKTEEGGGDKGTKEFEERSRAGKLIEKIDRVMDTQPPPGNPPPKDDD